MPLNTSILQNSLKAAFLANIPSATPTQVSQVDTLCASIATAMKVFVEGATITYTAGLANGGGPVAGVFGNVIT